MRPEDAAQGPEALSMIFVRIIKPASHLEYMGGVRMDLTAITTLIGSLGFPIAACIACFWMLNKERDEHKQEMQKVTEAITNNTMALNTLTERIGRDG